MPNRILQLQQERNAAIKKAADLLAKAATESRSLNTEETEQYDRIFTEIAGYRGTIDRETQQADLERSITGGDDQRGRPAPAIIPASGGGLPGSATKPKKGWRVNPMAAEIAADHERNAFDQFVRFGYRGVEDEMRSHLVEGNPGSFDFRYVEGQRPQTRAAQSELTGSLGGYLVPQGFIPRVHEAMLYYSGMMESGATILDTSMGNDLPMPTGNDTTARARILGESSPTTSVTLTFGQVIFKAFKYTSDVILVPLELLQDSGVDIEGYIAKCIGVRFGRGFNADFTVGTGTGMPRGITIDAVTGKTGANGQGTGLIYADLIDLKYSVNRAYRRMPSAGWMLNDNTLKAVLKIVDDNNRPLILDYLNALSAGEPEQILAQRLTINNDMADLGTTGSPAVGNIAILYGDFSNYFIRRVMSMLFMRLDERYIDQGQIGFLAFMRVDGRMVDAGTHPIKSYVSPTS